MISSCSAAFLPFNSRRVYVLPRFLGAGRGNCCWAKNGSRHILERASEQVRSGASGYSNHPAGDKGLRKSSGGILWRNTSKDKKGEDESYLPLGIDLGTTYTCLGIYKNEWVDIIPNEEGSRKTPSWIAFRDTERVIGDAARDQAPMNATNTVYDLKRILGRRFSDPSLQGYTYLWPFRVSPGPREQPIITVRYHGEERHFAAEEISAMLLAKLKEIAESFLQHPVTECVVTVPANFTLSQRQATANAGLSAGLNVLRVVNEPTAAALAYFLHKESVTREYKYEERKVLIYDLGGGTLSVAVIFFNEGVLEVRAMDGDSHLGGVDFDRRLVSHFANEFKKKHNIDITKNLRALRKLEIACERVKRSLSMSARTTIDIDALCDGIDFYCAITRVEFEDLNNDLFERCLVPVHKCLKQANLTPHSVTDIVLVGGSTRIPRVQQLLQELFGGKELSKNVNADEAVAFGAAIYAAILRNTESSLRDILPLEVAANSIGIETCGGLMTAVVEKGCPIPTKKQVEFTTYPNYQTTVLLNMYEGEEPRAADNSLIAVYELMNLPPAPPDGLKVVVIVEIDCSEHVQVHAELPTGQSLECLVRSPTTPLYPPSMAHL
ncbi:hypothetical protein R1sor_008230 [Riccia sorocarpa]|uniref:Uncharacterized protein n=1 Tax=Riccia sorocarpa TaxID=122646 RepID=A0ABD3HZ10_9MARC